MHALTMAELRLRHAQLHEKATRLEATWRTLPVGAESTQMGKQVRSLKERAEDYAKTLDLLSRASKAGIPLEEL